MSLDKCVDCGNEYWEDEYSYCPHCGGTLDPVPEPEEPCDHEMKELPNGMAQCIYCGVIED